MFWYKKQDFCGKKGSNFRKYLTCTPRWDCLRREGVVDDRAGVWECTLEDHGIIVDRWDSGFKFRVSGFGFWVSGFGFQGWGLGP